MDKPVWFTKKKNIPDALGRSGILHTPHGNIKTPAFVTVGTKATVKSLTPEQVKDLGAQVVLANTYHLYLEPGDEIVNKAGGLHSFMNWQGPTMTDSGGFQVFSLGEAYGKGVSKVATGEVETQSGYEKKTSEVSRAQIDEEGVTFISHKDGAKHRMTPEDSMRIQHNIGADIMFAFDECTSPHAPHAYQREAMERTHRWAQRCIDAHQKGGHHTRQGLFGVVQGGRFEDLRKESAQTLGAMNFAGYGVGGSFVKEDMDTAVGWVNDILPEDKPRHLLGIGEPLDILRGVEEGCDTFDCVAATRMARNGGAYVMGGKINLMNAQYRQDFSPIEEGCDCYTCIHYTRGYVSHLFRAKEMLASTLTSIHNLRFIIRFTDEIRLAIEEGRFQEYKEHVYRHYVDRNT